MSPILKNYLIYEDVLDIEPELKNVNVPNPGRQDKHGVWRLDSDINDDELTIGSRPKTMIKPNALAILQAADDPDWAREMYNTLNNSVVEYIVTSLIDEGADENTARSATFAWFAHNMQR